MATEKASSPYTTKEQTGLTADERIKSLFQPDTLASAQYETLRRSSLLQPEKRLMLAILEDAVKCLQENISARTGERKRLFIEAQDWVFGVRGDWVFSFNNVCDALTLNPEYVRQGLHRWMERNPISPSPYWIKVQYTGASRRC